jgi:hypothetical protein
VCPVRYELGFHMPEDVVLRSHRRDNLKLTSLSLSWHYFIIRQVSLTVAGVLDPIYNLEAVSCRWVRDKTETVTSFRYRNSFTSSYIQDSTQSSATPD